MENLKNKYDEGLITDRDIGNEVFFATISTETERYWATVFPFRSIDVVFGSIGASCPFFQTMLL